MSVPRTAGSGCSFSPVLPTPTARDGKDSTSTPRMAAKSKLTGIDHLLPTPRATDGVHGGPNRLTLVAKTVAIDGEWGKYTRAIERWEALTRPAPSPTEPNRNNKPRLTAAFAEWMMGWPAGWVTDVPGINRNPALKIIGNGVVPQQAVAALAWLREVSGLKVVPANPLQEES